MVFFRSILLGLFAFGLILPSVAEAVSVSSTRPNIVLILADDSGYSDLGCYGGEIATPTLDRLAAEGLRMSQMYSTSRCWPTRAALMTGYYPQQVGMDPIKGTFPKWVVGLPARLASAGYRPFHVGKWHIKNAEPQQMGFIDPAAIPDAPEGAVPPTNGDTDFGFPHSEAYTDTALAFLHDHAEHHSQKPFFLYLAYQAPHFPLRALESDIEPYLKIYKQGWEQIHATRAKRVAELGLYRGTVAPIEPSILSYDRWPQMPERLGPNEVFDVQKWDDLSPQQRQFQARKMAIHAAMMTRMDLEIGRIVEQLKAMGVFEDTLIVYLSDNGATAEMMIRKGDTHNASARLGSQETYLTLGPAWAQASNSPLRYYKMYAHEGGIATPAIFHWPSGIQIPNTIDPTPAHVIDVAATFLALAGLDPSINNAPSTMARSLLPLFNAEGELKSVPLYFSHRGKALRDGHFKAVSLTKQGENWALFDMRNDRAEQNDLSNQYPQKLRQMVDMWNALDRRFDEDYQP